MKKQLMNIVRKSRIKFTLMTKTHKLIEKISIISQIHLMLTHILFLSGTTDDFFDE